MAHVPSYHPAMDQRLASLSILLLATACSGPKSNCPANVTGSWTMTSTFCGTTDVTSDITTQGGISQMLLALSDTGGACRIVSTNSGPTCAETEGFVLTANLDGSFTLVPAGGITSCQPAACTFNASDAPCAIGDRADPSTLTSMNLDGGNLVVTSQPPAGLCGSYGVATIVTYQKG